MRRTLVVTNDFPPRQGGIQSYVHELARRQPAGVAGRLRVRPRGLGGVRRGAAVPGGPAPDRAALADAGRTASGSWTCCATTARPPCGSARRRRSGCSRPRCARPARSAIVASTHGHEAAWAMLPGAAPGTRPDRRGVRRRHLPHAVHPGEARRRVRRTPAHGAADTRRRRRDVPSGRVAVPACASGTGSATGR